MKVSSDYCNTASVFCITELNLHDKDSVLIADLLSD